MSPQPRGPVDRPAPGPRAETIFKVTVGDWQVCDGDLIVDEGIDVAFVAEDGSEMVRRRFTNGQFIPADVIEWVAEQASASMDEWFAAQAEMGDCR